MLCKLFFAALAITMAFGVEKAMWFWQLGCFLLCTFLLGGLLLALDNSHLTELTLLRNSVCYLDFSLPILCLCTCGAYFFLHLCQRIFRKRHPTDKRYEVFLRVGGCTISIPGLADSGNRLCDSFSGLPVIVCSEKQLAPILQQTPVEKLQSYRLLPCTTVTAKGLIPLFRPEELHIRSLSRNQSRKVDAMVGISGTQSVAIFHPDIY